jgi:LacI family transcriptional regulator
MAYPHKSLKIAETIASWFDEKRYKPGDRFPSDQELAKQFAVNHVTVRTALKRFVDAGILERRVGAGTMVRDPKARTETPTPLVGTGVALSLPDATHSFFSELLHGVEAALLGTARSLLFGHTWDKADREEQVVANWLGQGIRMMILTPPVLEARFYQGLLARGIRLVFVDRRVPGVDAPSIVSHDAVGMRAVVQYLIDDCGHQRMVHLSGPATIWTAQKRRESFEQTARAAGLAASDILVRPAGFHIEDGYRATLKLIDEGPLPPAIVAANDPVAVGAVRALQEKGFRVPEDVTVTGYGDTDLGRNFGLTTVRQFPERMGSEAVRLVLSAKDIGAADSIELIPELVVREGTAALPDLPVAISS